MLALGRLRQEFGANYDNGSHNFEAQGKDVDG